MGAVCVFWGLTEDTMSGIDGCLDAFSAGSDYSAWVAFLEMVLCLSRYEI